MHSNETAAIYVPEGHPLDHDFFKEGVAHINRRGYEFCTIARDWDTVVDLVKNREVNVIVFARREHMRPDWTPRVEYVGEETKRIVAEETKPRNDKKKGWGWGKSRRPRFTD
jgi:hypothetical protein